MKLIVCLVYFTSTIIVKVEDLVGLNITGLKTYQSNGTPVPLLRVVSWPEMILGRDDPKFGARILLSVLLLFFFAWETSFRRWKILHIL